MIQSFIRLMLTLLFTRDDGNLDVIMAEDFTSSESEDDEDGEEVHSSNGLGDAIVKAWNL